MPLSIIEKADGRVLEVQLTGKLTRADYQRFIPETERLFQKVGKISILVIMHDFHGWEVGAVWDDVKWDLKHYKDVARVALVGESKWQSATCQICKPFTRAEVRYFGMRDIQVAREWVEHAAEPVQA